MATRLYFPSSGTPPSGYEPAVDSAWEVTAGSFARLPTSTTKAGSAMTTVSFTDSDATSQDIVLRQYITDPLTAGQTFTGGQAWEIQCRGIQVSLANNMMLTVGLRVIASDASTVRKAALAVTRDGTEFSGATLTNRRNSGTTAATNYTTQAGDRIVIELGVGGDPGAGDHDCSIRIGDAAAADLAEDDTDTDDDNPWFELADTLTFAAAVTTVPQRTLVGVGT